MSKSDLKLNQTIELVNEPEAMFTNWISLSLITITVAMIFYGIADNSNAYPLLSSFLAISLMFIAIMYIYSGTHLFLDKMALMIKGCEENKVCFPQVNRIKYIKNRLLFLGIATGIFELFIALFVVWKTSKLLLNF